jgi:putative FmdB family regulatory protein
MPIYEFYCIDCHTIFNFLSRSANTRKRPKCPKCDRPKLDRKMSRFAISKQRSETEEGEEGMPDFSEAQMERMLAEMEHEADGMNEDDPRQMARLMRKLQDGAGLPMSDAMEEAIRRMEQGEDPDKIDEEMGDLLDSDDALFGEGRPSLKRLSRQFRPPNIDDALYEM